MLKQKQMKIQKFNLLKDKNHFNLKAIEVKEVEFFFQNFLKVKNIHHYLEFADGEPSIAARGSKTIQGFFLI